MRAVRCIEGDVQVVEVPRPETDGVRVRIRSAGICGSDLHMLKAGFPIPHTLGHEMAGELDDGTPVAIEPLVPCETCEFCADGRYNLCRSGPGMVLGVAHDGGMAEEVRVPERCLVPLAPGLEASDACLVEPLAVAVHGLRRIGLRGPTRVAVIGGGSIGLCAVVAAQAVGCEIALAARHDSQIEAGERLGACKIEGEYDVVIDAAGSESATNQAAELARPGGTLLLLASYWEGLRLPGFVISMKELSVVPASMYAHPEEGRDMDSAVRLLATQPEIARTLISHRLPLDAAPEAFRIAADRKSGALKVVLEP